MRFFPSAVRSAFTDQTGFTLYEAVITLSILGMVMLGMAGAKEFIDRHQLLVYANLLIGDLHLARSEAIKRGHPVTLCKSTTGLECTPKAPWESGWIVFADANRNHELDAKETILRVQQLTANNIALRYGETGTYRYVTYYPSGFAAPNATFTLCHKQKTKNPKGVIVYWTGRARITHERSDGSPLKCTES